MNKNSFITMELCFPLKNTFKERAMIIQSANEIKFFRAIR